MLLRNLVQRIHPNRVAIKAWDVPKIFPAIFQVGSSSFYGNFLKSF